MEDNSKPGETVPKTEFLAALTMLEERATLRDRWLAMSRPGHWLNVVRRTLLIERGENWRLWHLQTLASLEEAAKRVEDPPCGFARAEAAKLVETVPKTKPVRAYACADSVEECCCGCHLVSGGFPHMFMCCPDAADRPWE